MPTEQISPRYVELDSWSAAEMIAAMYEGQLAAAASVRGALGAIAAAVDDAVPALQRGGRIVYAGAGTSGRIGVQDGTELPPTFDWPPDRLVFAMAGGIDALIRSAEQAEDNEAAGAEAIAGAKIDANDVVIAGLGENPPRACVIPEFVAPAIVKADCIRFKPHADVLPKFANCVLNSDPVRRRTKNIVHGVGRPRLNLGEIKSIVMPLPPLAEQTRIVAEVERRLSVVEELEFKIVPRRREPARAATSTPLLDEAEAIEDPVLRDIYRASRKRSQAS